MTYELLAYLSVRATQIGMKACESQLRELIPKPGKRPQRSVFLKGTVSL